MQQRMIEALADVLDIDLSEFKDLSQDELLAMLESEQQKELTLLFQ